MSEVESCDLQAAAVLDNLHRRALRAEERLRDLTRRLGFGDNITEPQADNDTIVLWVDALAREADEWREHQSWLNDCAEAGCDPLEDCATHAPPCHPAHAADRTNPTATAAGDESEG